MGFSTNWTHCHTAKSIKLIFEKNHIELFSLAAQIIDLYPIVYLWAIIKRKLGNQKFNGFEGLKKKNAYLERLN